MTAVLPFSSNHFGHDEPRRYEVVGVHAMKRRWAATTLVDGLVKPSAAWFLLDTRDPDVVDRTLAAAVHLALGTQTCAELAETDRPGAYADLFLAEPGLLPAVLYFLDLPTGAEQRHRYTWLGAPQTGATASYTKVARAGRTTSQWRAHTLCTVELADIVRLEEVLDREVRPLGPDRLIRRHEQGDPLPAAVHSKLALFCVGLAKRLSHGPMTELEP